MFVTEGPVHPEHSLFVGRKAELRHMESWLEEASSVGVVAGARQTGKTSLVLKLRHQLLQKYPFVYVDLEAIYGADAATCFSYISQEILHQLRSLISNGEQLALATSSPSFLGFLRSVANNTEAVRMGVILDEVGALPHATSINLAHAIRAAFTNRHVSTEFGRFVFILSGSTDIIKLATNMLSPLRNVTDSVYTVDLSAEETDHLLMLGFSGNGVEASAAVRSTIYRWTSGHPYLTQLLGKKLVEQCQISGDAPNEKAVDSIVDMILHTEDKNLPHLRRALLGGDGQLVEYASAILSGGSVPFRRSDDTVAELELHGLIKARRNQCHIRNTIYAQALGDWLGEMPADSPDLSGVAREQSTIDDAKEHLRVQSWEEVHDSELLTLIRTEIDRIFRYRQFDQADAINASPLTRLTIVEPTRSRYMETHELSLNTLRPRDHAAILRQFLASFLKAIIDDTSLSDSDRNPYKALYMQHVEGRSQFEVESILNVSGGTYRRFIQIGRQSLAERLWQAESGRRNRGG